MLSTAFSLIFRRSAISLFFRFSSRLNRKTLLRCSGSVPTKEVISSSISFSSRLSCWLYDSISPVDQFIQHIGMIYTSLNRHGIKVVYRSVIGSPKQVGGFIGSSKSILSRLIQRAINTSCTISSPTDQSFTYRYEYVTKERK